MQPIAVLGLGLMGSSLCAALKARGYGGGIRAYARRETTRALALEQGLADAVFEEPAEAVRGSGLAVCCVPILSIPDLIGACRAGLQPGCVVTDVGSTKQALVEPAAAALAGTGAVFIGSHPIAGSERQGIEAASPDLYEGATVVITPEEKGTEAAARVEALWTRVGARVVVMDPSRHDRLLGRTSHLPHMVASALALAVGRGGRPEDVAPFCGTGFRDTTRVAEGSPQVWLDSARTNKVELARELSAFRGEIDALVRHLEGDDFDAVHAFLVRAKAQREALTGRGDGTA